MFNFFRKKTSEEIAAVKELKRLRKILLENGGPAKICYEYFKFLENDWTFQNWGFVKEEDAPYPWMVAILSALDLLNSWKIPSADDKQTKDLMVSLSRRVYVAALLSFDHEQLSKLHQDAGGVAGRITEDDGEAAQIADSLSNEISTKRDEAEAAWLNWKDNVFDVLTAIKQV
jgi:hypothetical protein